MQSFFPYRLAVLSHEVSKTIAQLYTDRFHLTRQEWRVLAALGEMKEMTAVEIADYSTLEKMQVSRAVAALEKSGLVMREEHTRDRRAQSVRLTDQGKSVYQKIVPLVLAREKFILSVLTDQELEMMDRIFVKLSKQTLEMQKMG